MEGKPRLITRRHRLYSNRRLLRSSTLRLLFVLALLWDTLHCISLYLSRTAALAAAPAPANSKRIFIAAQHWDSAHVLHSHWNTALLALVQELGIKNVFVSIYESGSFDDTKGALRELDAALGELRVARNIQLSDVSRADQVTRQPGGAGWIRTPTGDTQLRRIPFLASVRNAVFAPLEARAVHGDVFDTVLFLNDVVFTPADVLRLLDTNGGVYAAACALDYAKPPYFYDTFALRDSQGSEAVMQTWPWFRSRASRHAAERLLPVPVASCWNGMVAMPAQSFVGEHALRFRGIPDSLAEAHLEGSECCLIHADDALSTSLGVYLNPLVQVGYNGSAYNAVHAPAAVLSPLQVYGAVWKSRVVRWTTTTALRVRALRTRVQRWGQATGQVERGVFCLVDEMQVLYARGWRHV